MIDLTPWNLAVPTPGEPTIISTAQLNNGYRSRYFYPSDDGGIVFWVPVDGSHTEDARYPRTELRQTQSDGTLSFWGYQGADNYLRAILAVNKVPSKGKIVIGQIHSEDVSGSQNDPLLKLQYHYKDGIGRVEALLRKYPGDREVQNIPIATNVQLKERFKYTINLSPDGMLSIKIHSDDGDYGLITRQVSARWSVQSLYFKAGAYIQDNYGPSDEGGKVTFYDLDLIQH